MILLLPPLISLIGGLIIPCFKSRQFRNPFVILLNLLISAGLIFICQNHREITVVLFSVTPLFSVGFQLDHFTALFLVLIAFLWPISVLYSFEYLEGDARQGTFFCLYTLTYGITQLLAMSRNLFTLYLFYECLTLVTLPLITYHEDEESLQAGMTYLKYTIGGAALGLIGIMVLGHMNASGDYISNGWLQASGLPASMLHFIRAAFLLSFIGFGAKAAIIPLSGWLPRASVAPTPVTALLHAVAVVNAGVFACIRLTYFCFDPGTMRGSWVQTALLLLCSFTIVYGAVMAVRERHLKRRLAWSTVYNLSYMLFSAALMIPAGLQGALIHLLFHGLMKIVLFFCAGAFQVKAKAEYVPELRGIFHQMPATVILFTVAGIALIGIPPFVGFLSKWYIIAAAFDLGTWPAWIGACSMILSSVLACVYLLEPAIQMIFLPPAGPAESLIQNRQKAHTAAAALSFHSSERVYQSQLSLDPSWRMLVPIMIAELCIVLFGLWPDPVLALLSPAVSLF